MTGGPGRANMALSLTSIESASAAHTGGGRGGMIDRLKIEKRV